MGPVRHDVAQTVAHGEFESFLPSTVQMAPGSSHARSFESEIVMSSTCVGSTVIVQCRLLGGAIRFASTMRALAKWNAPSSRSFT